MSTTPSTIALSELAAKGADADFIKQTLQFALQRLMEMDVEALCKAAYGERTEERAMGGRDQIFEPVDQFLVIEPFIF